MKKSLIIINSPGRHVRERLPGGLRVLEQELDGCLQVERLNQGRLVEGQGVAHRADLEYEGFLSMREIVSSDSAEI